MTKWEDYPSTNTPITADNLLNFIYPIGSIFLSTNSANPSTYLGGTWAEFGKGKTLVGVDINQSEFNTVEKTGGAKTHTLTVNQIPSHNHSFDYSVWGQNSGYGQINPTSTENANKANIIGTTTNSIGGGQAHNNLQPYITCYMFKRTA